MRLASSGHGDTDDLCPDRKRLSADNPVLNGGEVIPAEMEEVVELIMGGEEPVVSA